ncbi:MAG: hypothetical protein M1829_006769 [Trizodia sp. TS-e1964]|nr:MAG: hypothetical protein M1829_006769 [Trizodia sp. TS-e1964]
MRRAAVQAFRTARFGPARKLITHRGSLMRFFSHGQELRAASMSAKRNQPGQPLASPSPHIRNFSLALVSTLVVSGAWYAYRDPSFVAQNFSTGSGSIITSLTSNNLQFGGTPTPGAPSKGEKPYGRIVPIERDQSQPEPEDFSGPLRKPTDDPGYRSLGAMTSEQATAKLRRNEESYFVGRGHGVVRYDVVQIPSNDPIEDDHAEKVFEMSDEVVVPDEGHDSSDWMFWGVFDGHSGWTTSATLREILIKFVTRELTATYKSARAGPSPNLPSPESIDNAIKKGFLLVDNEIVNKSVETVLKSKSRAVAAELLAPAISGSCALLSFYDCKSKLLRVACTGDSRAVLGRRGENGKWVATPLSIDQTGSNRDEAARLQREHPGEREVVMNGRVLGNLEPTRAFGDSSYKWSRETQERLRKSYFARSSSKYLRSPPYVTAEPVVTTTKLDPEKGDFVVMATDGLWEMLTNEEVIGLVGKWLETQAQTGTKNSAGGNSWLKGLFNSHKGLPVEMKKEEAGNGQKKPIRLWSDGGSESDDDRFVVQDKNVATHLVRNALGGKDTGMLNALLSLPSPLSRRYRDDLTVEVIFFGNGEKNGKLHVNEEASASGARIKARL